MTYNEYMGGPITIRWKVPFNDVCREAMARHRVVTRLRGDHGMWSACDCIATILGLYDANGERVNGQSV